jgi:hypothetical protein
VSTLPNPARGEAEIAGICLRPSFAALVAAEEELGPLFALVDRAAEGQLRLAEMVALFWHCHTGCQLTRDAFAERVAGAGLASATPALRVLLGQILKGG